MRRTCSASMHWRSAVVGLALDEVHGDVAQERGELALEVTDAGLAGVLGGEREQDLVGDLDLVGAQAVLGALAREQVVAGDRQLLLDGVAAQRDDLEAVAEDVGDGAELVGGAQEDDLGEVVVEVEVVVAEGGVLLGVEGLEEGRGRVAAQAGADELVELVEDDHRVAAAGALHGLDEAAGEGADVRASVAADLGVVAHAAERDADVLAAESLGDAAAEGGLADAGRADEAEDRAALVGGELADAEVLEHALFDLLEAVVLGLEEVAGAGRCRGCRGRRGGVAGAPGEVGDPLEVGAGDRRLAALRVHAAQAAELAVAAARASSGRSRASRRCSSSWRPRSSDSPSLSPSSDWMARSLWRRRASCSCLERCSRT
jgi:hypothetical protein